jgi:hypothetical protein
MDSGIVVILLDMGVFMACLGYQIWVIYRRTSNRRTAE